MTLFIRQSAIKGFKTCRRSTMLSYFQDGAGYEAVREGPASGGRDLGTIVHAGVEAFNLGQDPVEAIAILREAALAAEPEGYALSKEWEDVYTLARIMVEGYVEWVAETGADAGEETVAVEDQLEVPLTIRGEEVILTGKVDRLVLDTVTNELIVEDTKTVQTFDDLRYLALGDQLLTYIVLYRILGKKVNRGRHNQLRKVKRSATAKPPFYARVEFPFNDTQVDNYWVSMMAVLDEMVECIQAIRDDPEKHRRYAYPNPTRDCTWRCDFLPICPMMDDGSYWQGALHEMYQPRPNQESNV